MNRNIILLLTLFNISGVLIAFTSINRTLPIHKVSTSTKTIQVSGNGTVQLTPDLVYLNMGVHPQKEDIVQAIDENNALTNKVKDILVKYGVAEKDDKTSNFGVLSGSFLVYVECKE